MDLASLLMPKQQCHALTQCERLFTASFHSIFLHFVTNPCISGDKFVSEMNYNMSTLNSTVPMHDQISIIFMLHIRWTCLDHLKLQLQLQKISELCSFLPFSVATVSTQ